MVYSGCWYSHKVRYLERYLGIQNDKYLFVMVYSDCCCRQIARYLGIKNDIQLFVLGYSDCCCRQIVRYLDR